MKKLDIAQYENTFECRGNEKYKIGRMTLKNEEGKNLYAFFSKSKRGTICLGISYDDPFEIDIKAMNLLEHYRYTSTAEKSYYYPALFYCYCNFEDPIPETKFPESYQVVKDDYSQIKDLIKKSKYDFNNFIIIAARTGISHGGIACGPVDGTAASELVLQDPKTKSTFYFTLADFEGFKSFYLTNYSFYDKIIEESDDDDFIDIFNEYGIHFEEMFEMKKYRKKPWFKAFKYIFYLTRTDNYFAYLYLTKTLGKTLKSIKVADISYEE